MTATLQLRFLGAIEVTRKGKPVSGFESRKALALLGYLAASGQPVSRSQLADLFWGDKSEDQARANLSRALHNLSKLLPRAFITDNHTIEFARSPDHWSDLAAFEELAGEGIAASLTSAASLYRGEFMAGIFLDDCPDFEIWLVSQREHWRRRETQVLGRLMNYHRDRGDSAAALEAASSLIKLEPWNEQAHAQIMWLLARTGQRGAALMQYKTATQVLAEQLNVEPGSELKSLYERIRSGQFEPEDDRTVASSPLPIPPHNLPVQLTSFIARENELSDILEQLRNPACRLLTLVGPPGVGKTRLALEASARLVESFINGVCLVSLASIPGPQFLLTAIITALGFSPPGTEDPQVQLLNFLREKKLLLVLDNFEHLMDRAGLLTEILQGAPQVKLLVTSQERLNISGEWLLLVEGLKFPRLNSKEPVEDYAAARLFLDRARAVQPHFALTPANRAAVIRICQLVEGLPLGLELAAAWVGKFSCRYIAQEIERNLDFLAGSVRDVPARHRNLRAAIEWSYNLLTDAERVLLRRLGVFAGRFSLEAASAVCFPAEVDRNPDGLARARTLPLLSQLVDRSLIETDSNSEREVRFMILQPIRKFVLQRLEESGEQEIIQQNHARYFLELLETAEPGLRTAERDGWLERIDAVYDDLRAALEWSLAETERVETSLRIAAGLVWYWYFRSRLEEGRGWADRVLSQRAFFPRTSSLAKFLYGAGTGAWLAGSFDAAGSFLSESLNVSRALDDKASSAYALTFLGLVAMNRGHLTEARKLHEESGMLFSTIGDRWGLALSRTNLELCATQLGDQATAQAALEEAANIFRELRDQWGEGIALDNLGLAAYRRGDYPVAQARLEQAIRIRRKVGEKWLLVQSLNYLGNVLVARCDYAGALNCFEESAVLNRELGNKHRIAELLGGLAALAAATNRTDLAVRLFSSAETLRQALGSPLPEPDRLAYERIKAAVRAQTGETVWARQWEEGRQLSLDQAIASALEQPVGEPRQSASA